MVSFVAFLFTLEDFFQFDHELVDVFEGAVDRGETDVGDIIKVIDFADDLFADLHSGYFFHLAPEGIVRHGRRVLQCL